LLLLWIPLVVLFLCLTPFAALRELCWKGLLWIEDKRRLTKSLD
jgi:hypothetical protein